MGSPGLAGPKGGAGLPGTRAAGRPTGGAVTPPSGAAAGLCIPAGAAGLRASTPDGAVMLGCATGCTGLTGTGGRGAPWGRMGGRNGTRRGGPAGTGSAAGAGAGRRTAVAAGRASAAASLEAAGLAASAATGALVSGFVSTTGSVTIAGAGSGGAAGFSAATACSRKWAFTLSIKSPSIELECDRLSSIPISAR